MSLDYLLSVLRVSAREELEETLTGYEETQDRDNREAQTVADFLRGSRDLVESGIDD